jgi:hypothetical protein
MSQKAATRNYKMSDGELKQEADNLGDSITRDLADFATRKVTASNVTNLKTLATDFDNHSTDDELLGEVMAATAAKDAIANSIRIAIRPIRNMAENVYGRKGKYNSFGFDNMNDMSDTDLYRLCKRVVRVGTKYLTELAPEGLTAAQLATLTPMANSLDIALDVMEDKIEVRDIETQDRIVKGNKLWDEMVKLAGTGKSIYEDVNEAKYNDYVLMPSVGGGENPAPPAP